MAEDSGPSVLSSLEYLRKAGFRSIEMHHLPHEIQNNWYVVRK